MSDITEVIVHIVGLAMFMPQPATNNTPPALKLKGKTAVIQRMVESPPRITVVFPKVQHPPHGVVAPNANVNSDDTPVRDWTVGIENHDAIIAFRGDPISLQGWVVQHLWTSPQGDVWKYIKLSGEHLSLQAGVLAPLTSTKLALPHVDMVPNPTVLAPGYRAPSYSSAAAVLDVRDGVVTPCKQSIVDQGVQGRFDTEIRLPTNGKLTISGGTGKSLTLDTSDGITAVFLANVPLWYALHTTANAPNPDHYAAYCAMMSGSFTHCKVPKFRMTDPNPTQVPNCQETGMRLGGKPALAYYPPPAPLNDLTSFECSNTQWP